MPIQSKERTARPLARGARLFCCGVGRTLPFRPKNHLAPSFMTLKGKYAPSYPAGALVRRPIFGIFYFRSTTVLGPTAA
jgi:hypothetical protein